MSQDAFSVTTRGGSERAVSNHVLRGMSEGPLGLRTPVDHDTISSGGGGGPVFLTPWGFRNRRSFTFWISEFTESIYIYIYISPLFF